VRRPALLTGLVVAAAAFVVHAGTLSAGFVYDDHRFVEENPAIRSIDVVSFFADPATASAHGGIQPDVYRPLRTLDYAVDHALFGLDPRGWHLENLLWHALAAFLVFRLLLPLLRGNVLAAGLGALVFAVHPVTSEAVAWVSSRGDLLAVALLAGALIVLERPGALRTVLGTLLAVLACFSKESAVVAPALLPLRDLALPQGAAPPRSTTWWRTLVLASAVGAYLAIRLQVIPGLAQVEEFPGGSRVATARAMFAGLAWYGEALVLPRGFAFDVFLPVPFSWTEPAVVVGFGLLVTLLAAGVFGLVTGRRGLAFATLGALVCLLPVSNVVVPLKAFVAERFLYPVLVLVAAGVAFALASARGWLRPVLAGVVAIAVLGHAVVTWQRDASWKDEATLWDAVRRDRPDNPRAYEGIAFAAYKRGHVSLAENAYRSYLEHNPDDGKSWMLLGHVFGLARRTLRLSGPLEPGVTTDIAKQRDRAAFAQLSMYRNALAAWGRVGLVRGRGSQDLVRELQRERLEAAVDLGDLREAREANEGLRRLDVFQGKGPAEALQRRLTHLTLALQAAMAPLARLPGPAYEQATATRNDLLQDVGIDPALDGPPLFERLRELHEELLEKVPLHPEVTANLAEILVELGRRDEAIRRLAPVVERHPGRRDLRERLERLHRPERRPG
jgi:tetratricopeptide (TPR) repeat protein